MHLWAVHISDGVLSAPYWLGGFAGAALLLWWSSRRVQDEEIPRIAVMTAAFFVASLIHVKVGFTSVHLLFNALVGIVLGRRAVLAIAVGLFLQAMLLQHGGFTALGINCCVMALPALAAWGAFRALATICRNSAAHALLVGTAAFLFLLTLLYSCALLVNNSPWQEASADLLRMDEANRIAFQPLTLAALAVLAAIAVFFERRSRNSGEFALGLLIGELTVLLTVALNCTVLIFGGAANMTPIALILVVCHLPFALVEGTILGFTTAFLARVKPEMLHLSPADTNHRLETPLAEPEHVASPVCRAHQAVLPRDSAAS